MQELFCGSKRNALRYNMSEKTILRIVEAKVQQSMMKDQKVSVESTRATSRRAKQYLWGNLANTKTE